jgi:hypothetical protein
MTRTFKYFVCIQTTNDGRRWGISASGIGLFPDAHQVGKMISIYKECTPCDENGKVIAHVEPYKPISGQQTDGGHESTHPITFLHCVYDILRSRDSTSVEVLKRKRERERDDFRVYFY